MTTKMNLWSLTLLPGEKYPMYVQRDFVLTNAALGDELRSADGRSVIKVTHNPLPPHFGDDDSDSEFDSDVDIDEDDDEEEDEFELDEEEGFKLTPKKGKAAVNGDAEDDEDDEEDEDEEDEDEDDEVDDDEEDFDDDDEIEETAVICSLTAGKIEQANLNLTFVAGDPVMFETTGDNVVHLLGNYIYQAGPEDDDSEYDSEFDDEHDDYSDLELDDELLDDEDEAPAGKITEIAEAVAAKPKKAVTAAPAATENKKRKAEEIESPAPKAAAAAADADGLSKSQKKKLAKKVKRESEGAAPAAPALVEKKPEAKKEQSKQKKLPNGLIIDDVKVGDGPVAKTGKRLGMRYIGKLENGKQFDANTGGRPFTFVLGRGEVIKGWDQGLVGMHVGGERRLTIPAPLAYGNQKLPGIPKGSTLVFDVKLVSVN